MRNGIFLVTLLALSAPSAPSVHAADVPLRDWTVPSTAAGKGGPSLHGDLTHMLPFVGITPCRLVDTRGNGAPITGGAYAGGEQRAYAFGGLCGLPPSVVALSLNITVTETAGPGFITAWRKGTPKPETSTLNYVAGQTLSNAALTAADREGGVSFVAGVSGTHLIVDVNGYFNSTPASPDTRLVIQVHGDHSAISVDNSNESCNGPCGIAATIHSTASDPIAIDGRSHGDTGGGVGVFGLTSGGGTGIDTANAAGVRGRALSSIAAVHGVRGEVVSESPLAAGVAGISAASTASGGLFRNEGADVTTFLATRTSGVSYALLSAGEVYCGKLTASIKNFVAPHPEDASREIAYVSVEGPSADIFHRGRARLEAGVARVPLPRHFVLSARDGSHTATAQAIGTNAIPLAVEMEGKDALVVRGRADVEFHYVVYAEREAFRDHDPTPPNAHFTPDILARIDPMRDLPPSYRELLVKNGTLEADGTFNRATAARLGWTLPTELAPRGNPPAAGARERAERP